jgi:hypothetical protein
MGIERLYMHGTKPARAHDLGQPFGIGAVGLVELDPQCCFCMARIKTDHVETKRA